MLNPPNRERYRDDISYLPFRTTVYEVSGIKQSDTERRRLQQGTHLSEMEKQGFAGQNQSQQLKTHPRVVAYHSRKF
jgi:hypothetical protein